MGKYAARGEGTDAGRRDAGGCVSRYFGVFVVHDGWRSGCLLICFLEETVCGIESSLPENVKELLKLGW